MTRLDPAGPSERRRVAGCLAIGLLAGLASAPIGVWELAILVGWNVTAAAFSWSVWRAVSGADAASTMAHATSEDNSRSAARGLVVAASASSLVGVLFGLARASDAHTGLKTALTITALSTVVLSWVVIQTVFTLRYAHLYYDKVAGGVDFPGDDEPEYRDFAYLAFTVGMTYQVADTNITGRPTRRTLLLHALLSYVYGAVVVAVAINLVAGFVGN
jgi:uncharacterized membrane protein